MQNNRLSLLVLFMVPIFSFLLFSGNTVQKKNMAITKKSIELHEQISHKKTRAWEPFLDQFINQGDVVLKFYASYCGPCDNMAPLFDAVAQELPNITFVKIHSELFPSLVTKFKINSIPTLIFLRNGKEIGRYEAGALTKDKLSKLVSSTYRNK